MQIRTIVKRLEGKTAVVVGAGQTPGQTIGNGRATALLFAREGARVLLVDKDLKSAQETEAMIRKEGGESLCFQADISVEEQCRALAEAGLSAFGRIDILHNNVGIGDHDTGITGLTLETWNRIMDVNLKGMFLTCKHVIPIMRQHQSGAIVNISSAAAVSSIGLVAYKTSKAGVNALTQAVAMGNAKHGIRCNAIMPGLMDTPMAVEGQAKARGISREDLVRIRNKRVPLKGGMGTAWDVAYAALFLASDEAKFITGTVLPVDGGQTASVG